VRDISEVERIERELRESRDQLSLALDAARMGTWDWDIGSGALAWSGDLEAVHGMAPGSFDGTFERFISVVHPEDREQLQARIGRSLETGEQFSAEFRVIGDDGVVRWVAGDGRVIRDGGRPVRMIGIGRDVTEHRRTLNTVRESEERFRSIADAAPVFIWIADTAGGRTYFNEEWLRYRGRAMGEELGDGWVEGVHPEDLERSLAIYRDAIRRRKPYETEYRLRRADGEYRWMLVRAVPRIGSDGAFDGFIGWCVDITERHDAEEQWRLLAAIGMVLDRPLSLPERLEALARILLPAVADACIVALADEEGALRQVAVTHVDPLQEQRLQALPAPTEQSPMARVAATREALLVPDVAARLDSRPPGTVADAVRGAWQTARSAVMAPLVARGRLVGVLALATSREHSSRPMDERDLRLAREIAARAALAIDNARLFEAERQAARRVRFLSEASRLLGSSLEYEQTLQEVARLAVPGLADCCAVHLVTDTGRLELVALAHADADAARWTEALSSSDPLSPAAPGGSGSSIRVPMTARGAVVGALTLLAGAESARSFDDGDLGLARELAERAASAIDNARLYDAQHTIAGTLQRALLPPSLPAIPGVRLGAAYVAMGRGVEAGGDFYDVVRGAGGRWLVVVGDVCGKGPEAASLTALARYTLRAVARRDPEPAGMLQELNRDIVHQRPGNTQFLTACLGLLDPVGGGLRVRLASAGHPPALVVRAAGPVERTQAIGALVGVLPEIRITPCELSLGPGDRLVLYTDGLVEARTSAGDLVGEAGVLEAIQRLAGASASELASGLAELARGGPGGRARDDVAVLVVEAAPDSG
jgi:PAS domain S-box-containing protein